MITKPQGSSVKALDANTNTTFDLTNHIASVAPVLTIPAILDLIRNTSVRPAESITGNTIYYGAVKPVGEKTIGAKAGTAGNELVKDPRAITSREIEAFVKRLPVEQFADKLHGLGYDLNTIKGRQMLAQQVATWIGYRRMNKSIQVLAELVAEVKAVAITGTPTTFATGAHIETKAITSSDEAYSTFASAVSNFQRIGLSTAKADENKNYKRAIGISKNDMVVLMTPEFEALILGKQGVFASEMGNADFKNAGLKKILGVATTTALELPEDVDFMVLTTGLNGTIGHQLIGDGIGVRVLQDPDWSFGQRVDMVDNYSLGVIYPFQAFIHTSK